MAGRGQLRSGSSPRAQLIHHNCTSVQRATVAALEDPDHLARRRWFCRERLSMAVLKAMQGLVMTVVMVPRSIRKIRGHVGGRLISREVGDEDVDRVRGLVDLDALDERAHEPSSILRRQHVPDPMEVRQAVRDLCGLHLARVELAELALDRSQPGLVASELLADLLELPTYVFVGAKQVQRRTRARLVPDAHRHSADTWGGSRTSSRRNRTTARIMAAISKCMKSKIFDLLFEP